MFDSGYERGTPAQFSSCKGLGRPRFLGASLQLLAISVGDGSRTADDGDALLCHAGSAATQMIMRTSSLNKGLRLMAF